ncbi:hypothetical protein PQX77_013940 [Marasmius sp. AFHP31]|nr:hypothetical protein PQX77_013940 [Marasmius sp. AFHP31]
MASNHDPQLMLSPPECEGKFWIRQISLATPANSSFQLKDFGAHTKNLECFSEGFPPAGWVTNQLEEVVFLTESSKVLRLLLGFMDNTALPDLEEDKIAIDTLLSLCEAAEKYGNFIALQACRRAILRRAEKIDGDALLKVLRFKICHSNLQGINDVARRTVDIPVKDVWRFCKGYPEVYYFWSRYQIA